jgi:SAM-dependent methyltransferase
VSSHTLPRSVFALAFADEVIGDSAVLTEYSRGITRGDDVTLFVYAPDADADDLERRLAPLAAACGLDSEESADIVGLALPGDAETRATIRSKVDCLLSSRPAPTGFEGVPVIGPEAIASVLDLRTRSAFTCNVCGDAALCEAEAIGRELSSCSNCGSTVRFRAVAHAVSLGLFGTGMPLTAFPARKDLVGVGLSDWDGYACRLATSLSYRNTFFHTEPRIDILDPDPSLAGTLDFLISSEVFEHVPPPMERAFAACARLLKPGGFLVLTVPYILDGETSEHFPELNDWTIAERGGRPVLFNATTDGRLQEFDDLVFHGGGGLTLEMRLCALDSLLRGLQAAGFDEIEVLNRDVPEFGIWQETSGSWPILARKTQTTREATAAEPVARADEAAAFSRMKKDWDERARENAQYYIASSRDDWQEEEFSEHGRHSVELLVADDLDLITGGRPADALVALEIGCGVGRMTEHLAAIFKSVEGVDVSGEMVQRGRARLARLTNVTLTETSGADVAHLSDESIDFAFSFIVFQHVPFRDAIVGTIRDVHRALRPGSIFKFQVQGSQQAAYLEQEKDTWQGVTFTQREIDEIAAVVGFDVLRSDGAGTQYFWQWWRKPDAVAGAGSGAAS